MMKLPDLFQLHANLNKKGLAMAELKRKIDACGMDFPMELTGKAGDYPDRTVIPCPVRVGDETIAGLFLFCPEEDIERLRSIEGNFQSGSRGFFSRSSFTIKR